MKPSDPFFDGPNYRHPLCKDRNALKYVLPALTKRGEGADNELTRDAVTGIINRLYPDKEQAGPIIEDVLSGKKKLCICKYHFPENSFVPRGPSGRTAYRYGYKEDPEGCRNEKYLPYTLEEEEELNRQVKAGELVRDNNCRPFKKIKITKDGVPVRDDGQLQMLATEALRMEEEQRAKQQIEQDWLNRRGEVEGQIEKLKEEIGEKDKKIDQLVRLVADRELAIQEAHNSAKNEVVRARAATEAAEERARAAENERKMMENDRIAPLTFARVAASNELTRRYTGFSSTETLIEFTKICYDANKHTEYDINEKAWDPTTVTLEGFSQLPPPNRRGRKREILFREALLLTLMRAKCRFSLAHLSYLFKVGHDTAHRTFHWVIKMFKEVYGIEFANAVEGFSKEEWRQLTSCYNDMRRAVLEAQAANPAPAPQYPQQMQH